MGTIRRHDRRVKNIYYTLIRYLLARFLQDGGVWHKNILIWGAYTCAYGPRLKIATPSLVLVSTNRLSLMQWGRCCCKVGTPRIRHRLKLFFFFFVNCPKTETQEREVNITFWSRSSGKIGLVLRKMAREFTALTNWSVRSACSKLYHGRFPMHFSLVQEHPESSSLISLGCSVIFC